MFANLILLFACLENLTCRSNRKIYHGNSFLYFLGAGTLQTSQRGNYWPSYAEEDPPFAQTLPSGYGYARKQVYWMKNRFDLPCLRRIG